MPASDSIWRNLRTMHVVFAVSSVGLFVCTIWMMADDYDDQWRVFQRKALELQAEKGRQEIAAIQDYPTYEENIAELEAELERREAALAEAAATYETQQRKVDELEAEYNAVNRDVRAQRAIRDARRADYDLGVRDDLPAVALDELMQIFEAEQAKVDELEQRMKEIDLALQNAKLELAETTADRDEALKALNLAQSDVDRLRDAVHQIEPESWFRRLKRDFMHLPIVEGFNSPEKIHQDWLPELKIDYGGMAEVARFDRCRTCHLMIDKIEAGNAPAYPLGFGEGEYPNPYASHPRPDVFLTATSPHPLTEFGCTECHAGQGSGTSFSNASHTPNDPLEHEHWAHQYDFQENHFWEYPMHPERFRESGCIKCHHHVVELAVNPEFGPTAPKVYNGFQLVRQYGCFGCHEINGYDAGEPIGPDLRLEPNYASAAKQVLADPAVAAAMGVAGRIKQLAASLVDEPDDELARDELLSLIQDDRSAPEPKLDRDTHAMADALKPVDNPGEMRKVGPSLRHVASKTTQAWVEYWTEEPKRFRPGTRMPQFFKLTNQQDQQARRYQTAELAGIAQYLISHSQPLELMQPREGYQPDAERGKTLFSQRGCLACHSHADFPKLSAAFGPNLSKVSEKIRPGADGFNWLYTWVRDPQRHHPRSKMPDLYLEPTGEGESYVDPAADIAAYLLKLEGAPADFQPTESYPPLAVNEAVLDEVVRMYLAKTLTADQIKQTFARRNYPMPIERIKGDEIEMVPPGDTTPDDEEWRQMKLNYVGRRTISRYGCYGCHDVPGFENARPIGTALQDWGRKDTSRLAFEHIAEFLHHHGEPDGGSTRERVADALGRGQREEFKSDEQRERELSAAYFYQSLEHHGRPGFIWQKLRAPRSYDYEKTATKGYDERLRMPKFPLDEREIEEIATFVLGLVAEPPAEEYLYRPEGAEGARIAGELLLEKFNCTGCHMVELPSVTYRARPENLSFFDGSGIHPESLEVLHALKPPHDIEAGPRELTAERFSRWLGRHAADLELIENEQRPADDISDAELPADAVLRSRLRGLLAAHQDGRLRLSELIEVAGADAKQQQAYLRRFKQVLSDVLGDPLVRIHGLVSSYPDPLEDQEFQEYGYDLWETADLYGGLLAPATRMLVPATQLESREPGRGGEFAEWLVEGLVESRTNGNRSLAWQMAPPPLYLEGTKVQTPWLYNFLRSPEQLRHTTVLRMPGFNLSREEAQELANYFAAVDGVPFPYQPIPQREPSYLAEMNAHLQAVAPELAEGDYLDQSWKLLNANLCIKCHSLAGRQVAVSDPKTDIRGPNLELTRDRLRPEWLLLWLYNPKWITPFTSMPQPLPPPPPGADGPFPALLGNDGNLQTIGLRDALMNYYTLMEQQGRTVYEPPGAAAPTTATKD